LSGRRHRLRDLAGKCRAYASSNKNKGTYMDKPLFM